MTQNAQNTAPLANNHISVDCVLIGFDGEQLKVLLLKRMGEEEGEVFHDMKLPGSLIYQDEDLDEAAMRVLNELTGLKNVNLIQFKVYGSKNRTKDPRDVHWLERAMNSHVDRIVTIGYHAMVKIDRKLVANLQQYEACWVPIDEVKTLAFDHNQILKDALVNIRQKIGSQPALLFELLPRKFTAAQLRILIGLVSGTVLDVRNFHKKIAMMEYVVPLEEKETGVNHRAARYYQFDRKLYQKLLTKAKI